MGTLAIRQGDVLFFARSLVWSITSMSNIEELDDIGRIERFQNLWQQREMLLGKKLTQEEVDDLALQCKVKTVQLPRPSSGSPISAGTYKKPGVTRNRGGF